MSLAESPSEPVRIPPLDIAIELAMKKNPGIASHAIGYEVKKYYYEIQSKTEQMDISEEVREHFDKAVKKSEEKYDEGEDENITQSAITKLKLGRSGTLNDIIELRKEIHVAILNLAHLTGLRLTYDSPMEDESITAVPFNYQSLTQFLSGPPKKASKGKKQPGKQALPARDVQPASIEDERWLMLQKAYLEVAEAKAKVQLAQKSRKITRVLLVTEVSNYDFGIGDSGDLFEALIIYTRVLRGYYQTLFKFNVAVADLERKKQLALK